MQSIPRVSLLRISPFSEEKLPQSVMVPTAGSVGIVRSELSEKLLKFDEMEARLKEVEEELKKLKSSGRKEEATTLPDVKTAIAREILTLPPVGFLPIPAPPKLLGDVNVPMIYPSFMSVNMPVVSSPTLETSLLPISMSLQLSGVPAVTFLPGQVSGTYPLEVPHRPIPRGVETIGYSSREHPLKGMWKPIKSNDDTIDWKVTPLSLDDAERLMSIRSKDEVESFMRKLGGTTFIYHICTMAVACLPLFSGSSLSVRGRFHLDVASRREHGQSESESVEALCSTGSEKIINICNFRKDTLRIHRTCLSSVGSFSLGGTNRPKSYEDIRGAIDAFLAAFMKCGTRWIDRERTVLEIVKGQSIGKKGRPPKYAVSF